MIEKRFSIQRAKRNASLSQRRLRWGVFNQAQSNVLVSVWSATKKDRRPSADAEREWVIERGDMRGMLAAMQIARLIKCRAAAI